MSGQPLLERLDPVLEHRVRLAACVLLSRTEEISFSRFKELLQQTDGNLGAQLRKLEDEGYIELRREFSDRRPVTWYHLTPAGRRALKRHLAGLEAIIGAAEPH
jgi:DNA-binding MarR family transcriptional regulator